MGDWTIRGLIPNIRDWKGKRRGNVDFYVTQLLTGLGSFGQYLYKIGKRATPQCDYCQEIDKAEHTIFVCPRWARNRSEIPANRLTPDILINWLVFSDVNWNWFRRFAGEVLRSKEEEARRRGM
ncbi:uncharacterized protein LOC142322759 [Lycorma delicatula]|uniref:uncharacterized protein LOC142322759 n=1 Tax=Lycorma delicatula TaxID=130591 RepID=UPI003F50D8D2